MILSSFGQLNHAEIIDLSSVTPDCSIAGFPDDRAIFGTFIDDRLVGCDDDGSCYGYSRENNSWIEVNKGDLK